MNRSVDAVVFDLGGVITMSSPFDAAARMAAELGVAGGDAIEALFGPYDDDTDHPWHRAERGQLDITSCRGEVLEHSRERLGVELDLFRVLEYMGRDGTGMRPEVVERLHRLRQHPVQVGLLTNNIVEFAGYWRTELPVDDLFDVVIDSSEVGIRKPDPAVFELMHDSLGRPDPSRIAFLDDWPGNVVAATGLGWKGILVGVDPTGALAALDELMAW